MMLLWTLVVAANGLLIGYLPWEGTYAACERTALESTLKGQQQRAALGLPPNGARAYCVYARKPPVIGTAAPRPGVQV